MPPFVATISSVRTKTSHAGAAYDCPMTLSSMAGRGPLSFSTGPCVCCGLESAELPAARFLMRLNSDRSCVAAATAAGDDEPHWARIAAHTLCCSNALLSACEIPPWVRVGTAGTVRGEAVSRSSCVGVGGRPRVGAVACAIAASTSAGFADARTSIRRTAAIHGAASASASVVEESTAGAIVGSASRRISAPALRNASAEHAPPSVAMFPRAQSNAAVLTASTSLATPAVRARSTAGAAPVPARSA
mmetsp:Transcript_39613/g.122484  ORF Transcript_39613/g.122484 Transcript_39613/m.122484 type:complete len:247 (+) Transcript_39613:2040-2780(+)